MGSWGPALATIGVTVFSNLIMAAYVYGKLAQKTVTHSRAIETLEATVSGPNGHGERIASLETAVFPDKHALHMH